MTKDSSRVTEIKGSNIPAKYVDFWIGTIIFRIRNHQLAPTINAASSISSPICLIALIPAFTAYGRALTEQTITSSRKEPCKDGMGPRGTANIAKNVAPNAIEGIK